MAPTGGLGYVEFCCTQARNQWSSSRKPLTHNKKMHFRQFRQRIFFAFASITGNLAFVVQVCALPLPSI